MYCFSRDPDGSSYISVSVGSCIVITLVFKYPRTYSKVHVLFGLQSCTLH